MSKIIEINKCSDCIHANKKTGYCRKEFSDIGTYPAIPNWCPLKDAEMQNTRPDGWVKIDKKLYDTMTISVASALLSFQWLDSDNQNLDDTFIPPSIEQVRWEYQNVPRFHAKVDALVSTLFQDIKGAKPKPEINPADCLRGFGSPPHFGGFKKNG